ncbi:MAG: STAS domain-containing protein [Actinomycetota bacterium]|nr:STAS domain-containing protein [Actinomycetota bacterium]
MGADRTLHIERADRPRAFRLRGELDIVSEGLLLEALAGDLEGEGDLTLDVSALEFMDSSGLRAILQAAQKLGTRGTLVLASPPEAIRRLLDVSGVADVGIVEIADGR